MEDLSGKIVYGINGAQYHLTKIAGQGAQGVIYEEATGTCMVKLVFQNDPVKKKFIRDRFMWLLRKQYDSRFISPIDILREPFTGYVMKRIKKHQSLNKLLQPDKNESFGKWYNETTGGLKRRLLLGKILAGAFKELHYQGLSYCDLSGQNILVAKDSKILSVCIIDIDNLTTPSINDTLVLGTPRYMAPEVILRKMQPDSLTDSYSLAVLLFELLRIGHPFLGDEIMDLEPELENDAYLGKFPYIDDPNNMSNSCSRLLPIDVCFTEKLKQYFEQTFIAGKLDRKKRVTCGEWELACEEAANSLVKCTKCPATFYPKTRNDESGLYTCPWCKNTIFLPPFLAFYDLQQSVVGVKKRAEAQKVSTFILQPGINSINSNYLRYCDENRDTSKPVLQIAYDRSGKISLYNISEQEIYFSKVMGPPFIKVQRGETVSLEQGMLIWFKVPDAAFKNEYGTTRYAKLIFRG